MRRKLETLVASVREGLWFVPTILVAGSVGLAYLALDLDRHFDSDLSQAYPHIFGVSAAGAYSILSAIATSMATVAGVTFSITVVALSLAANQYSPRTLRNYMRDRGNRLVLGSFLGVFAYALLQLRMIRSEQNPFVPSIGVLTGIALAMGSLGLFIYFIHHVSASLSVEHIVSTVYRETVSSLERLANRDDAPTGANEDIAGLDWHGVPALDTGYLQNLDILALVTYAHKRNCVMRVAHEVGDFIVKGETLLEVSGAERPGKQAVRELNDATILLRFRSIYQDPGFGIRQILDVALRALSPGINDTTTALTCIDYLGAVLTFAAAEPDPTSRHSKDGCLRVITRGATVASLIARAFHPLIPSAASHPEVLDRTLGVLERLEKQANGPDRVRTLSSLADEIGAAASHGVWLHDDRRRILQRSARLSARLSGQAG